MLVEVPSPAPSSNRLIIQSRRTLISAGTEKMLVEFGQASWIGKAKAQPEKVKQVVDKIRTDGLMPTLEAVFSKLGEPIPLGYCNAGVVTSVGVGAALVFASSEGRVASASITVTTPTAATVTLDPLTSVSVLEQVSISPRRFEMALANS